MPKKIFFIQPFDPSILYQLKIINKSARKGENGKVLVIGGSSLFHSPSIWAAELLAHFADLVFYYSPAAINNKALISIKKSFKNGIIVHANNLIDYIKEADVVLIGPGMVRRSPLSPTSPYADYLNRVSEIEHITDEGVVTYVLINALLHNFPQKKWVIDAGALQEVEGKLLPATAICTPHAGEMVRFLSPFAKNCERKLEDVSEDFFSLRRDFAPTKRGYRNPPDYKVVGASSLPEKKVKKENVLKAVDDLVARFPCQWVFKDRGMDYIFSPQTVPTIYVVGGGNEGLTKGGTGDLLSALTAAFYIKNNQVLAAEAASFVLKQTADELYKQYGPYYTTTQLAQRIPAVFWKLQKNFLKTKR